LCSAQHVPGDRGPTASSTYSEWKADAPGTISITLRGDSGLTSPAAAAAAVNMALHSPAPCARAGRREEAAASVCGYTSTP